MLWKELEAEEAEESSLDFDSICLLSNPEILAENIKADYLGCFRCGLIETVQKLAEMDQLLLKLAENMKADYLGCFRCGLIETEQKLDEMDQLLSKLKILHSLRQAWLLRKNVLLVRGDGGDGNAVGAGSGNLLSMPFDDCEIFDASLNIDIEKPKITEEEVISH